MSCKTSQSLTQINTVANLQKELDMILKNHKHNQFKIITNLQKEYDAIVKELDIVKTVTENKNIQDMCEHFIELINKKNNHVELLKSTKSDDDNLISEFNIYEFVSFGGVNKKFISSTEYIYCKNPDAFIIKTKCNPECFQSVSALVNKSIICEINLNKEMEKILEKCPSFNISVHVNDKIYENEYQTWIGLDFEKNKYDVMEIDEKYRPVIIKYRDQSTEF